MLLKVMLNGNINLIEGSLEVVNEFVYLGIVISKNGGCRNLWKIVWRKQGRKVGGMINVLVRKVQAGML